MHSVLKSMLTLVAVIALSTQLAQAQVGPEEKGERIKQFRVAIFTEVLNLTVEEAQGFWPVYNAFLDKREALLEQQKPGRQLDGMNDAEVEEYIKKHFELKQRELELEKDLVQQLRKVLPPRKIAKLPIAEREFRESLLKKIQELRQQRRLERSGGRN